MTRIEAIIGVHGAITGVSRERIREPPDMLSASGGVMEKQM